MTEQKFYQAATWVLLLPFPVVNMSPYVQETQSLVAGFRKNLHTHTHVYTHEHVHVCVLLYMYI